jgi:solute:Na+ symporter, SSS family
MHPVDLSIFVLYMLGLLGMGVYFMRKNKSTEDYFISGRNMNSLHIGLSVVATDVGGGFSIGLGGLGFLMGLSGSWMLFTGLIGAWLSAVILIPRVHKLGSTQKFSTLPQLFGYFFNGKVAMVAGIISAIGYFGFTGSQILAGAKLASSSLNGLDINTALMVMGIVTILYTVMGGMTAVIYTDTVQWIVLMTGLIFVGIPLSYNAVGGWEEIKKVVPEGFLSLSSISWQQIVNWAFTIIPIWFVGMTLYQRIYASKSEKSAKKAWFFAGLLEWPLMAFMGVLLGLFSRVAAEQGMFAELGFPSAQNMDHEQGLPMLLKQILPVGLMGVMLSVYFSAILSTADSCLMAASGNMLTDILQKLFPALETHPKVLRITQLLTLILGAGAMWLAASMENVLELMLHSYAFMVSGLLIPIVAAIFFGQRDSLAAICSMFSGGICTLWLIFSDFKLPYGLEPIIFGICLSILVFAIVSQRKKSIANETS